MLNTWFAADSCVPADAVALAINRASVASPIREAPPAKRIGMPYSCEIAAYTPIADTMFSGLPSAIPQTISGRRIVHS